MDARDTEGCGESRESVARRIVYRDPTPPPLGALVLLLFHTPEGEVRVRATVRNVKPGKGMGLAITSMEQDHRARLSRWLQLLAKQAESATEPVAAG